MTCDSNKCHDNSLLVPQSVRVDEIYRKILWQKMEEV